jgi:hypothetical protein
MRYIKDPMFKIYVKEVWHQWLMCVMPATWENHGSRPAMGKKSL